MSASGAWGPAPPGVDLSESQDREILTSVITIMVIGITAVILRLAARLKSRARLGLDDYCVLAALTFAIGTAILCIISVPYGGGKHLWVVTSDEFTTLWKMTYAFVLIYATCVSLTKASILLYYRRIFGANWAHHICMGLVVGYWVSITIAWFSGCRPVTYFWEQFTKPTAKGYCMNTSLFYFINGICAMLIDVAILIVPMPTLYKLQMPLRQKIAVGGILLLGAFVCVASIIRIIAMDKLVKADDFTWRMAQVFIWSCCEPFVGIVCACLPTYGPFLRRFWRKIGTSDRYVSGTSSNNLHNTNIERNKARMQWKQLHGDDVQLRGDDEMELTTDIRGGRQASLQTKDSDGDETADGMCDVSDYQ
ncbi:uncharacterized protein NECHADRAFT_84327 [Fusarium vanettenii 77-13-4]|uniref:Rhodopsin domain-containing protein n=1 Tax=Fusarium vanettenii (strain ATCC MYA-4622 / CBS 123669 / FGSC 9596 / NRRL 45880 / 77-13-4) TaxID=660122 RepID=C7ZCS9_FUSV7|nr:uncharacterized protein NECHADRAFT_84327 [Fusarium vanettenii 77-13-4]EEU38096.1 hypothetical protein NECHADRAFT_84327 [Fusarium vanettenii 77-13-4]